MSDECGIGGCLMDVGVAYGCVDGEVSQRLDERTDE